MWGGRGTTRQALHRLRRAHLGSSPRGGEGGILVGINRREDVTQAFFVFRQACGAVCDVSPVGWIMLLVWSGSVDAPPRVSQLAAKTLNRCQQLTPLAVHESNVWRSLDVPVSLLFCVAVSARGFMSS